MAAIAYPEPEDLLTGGIYSIRMAGRILQERPESLRRWVRGYSRGAGERLVASRPLWISKLQAVDRDSIGFLDLLELRFISQFRKCGVSLQLIRRVIEVAREEMNAEYPFAMKRFVTDGNRIFSRIEVDGRADGGLLDVAKRQAVFARIVEGSLLEEFDFDLESGVANAWKPAPRVFLRPALNFGHPTVRAGVPTRSLAAAFRAELGDKELVAREFDVDVADVVAAVEFEQRLAA